MESFDAKRLERLATIAQEVNADTSRTLQDQIRDWLFSNDGEEPSPQTME